MRHDVERESQSTEMLETSPLHDELQPGSAAKMPDIAVAAGSEPPAASPPRAKMVVDALLVLCVTRARAEALVARPC